MSPHYDKSTVKLAFHGGDSHFEGPQIIIWRIWAILTMLTQTLKPMGLSLRPVIETLIPATQTIDNAGIFDILDCIDRKLRSYPPSLRIQLRLFATALDYMPLAFYGKRFRSLTPEQRFQFLERLQYSPIKKLRVGLWGFRTLIYMGYYGNPHVQQQIGYHPDIRGWEALERRTRDEVRRMNEEGVPSP